MFRDRAARAIDGIRRDARHAMRAMRQVPGFTALAVTTLALGIGVNTASVAVAYGVLVRPLPYAEPSAIVVLNLLFADGNDMGFSARALQDWLPRLQTVDPAAGYHRAEVTVRSGGRRVVVPAAFVTDRFFDVLGTRAEFGRVGPPASGPEVLVSRRALDRIVSGAPAASVGAPISIGDRSYTIGGIMPSDFAFPDDQIAVWVRSPGTTFERAGYAKIVARLAPGVTVDGVREDAGRVRDELSPAGPDAVPLTVSVEVLGESVIGGLRRILLAAVAGALLVLLVASANVATLFIGRAVARQRELAARLALGATSLQLVRSVLVETSLVALLGALAGIGLGIVALRVFVSQAADAVPGLHRVAFGLSTAFVIAALTAAVTALCAAVPAWQAARADAGRSLRTTAASRPLVWRLRSTLVIAQIALSCVLLIGAGLLARTVAVLMREDHGFQPGGALEARIVLSDTVQSDGAGRERFVRELLDRVRATPGVQAAGFGTNLPPRPALASILTSIVRDGRRDMRLIQFGSATPGYLHALGAQFVAGRDFDERDGRFDAAGVIVSESLARFFFPDRDPLGETITLLPSIFGTAETPRTLERSRVVGVVRDIKYEGLDSPASVGVYVPWDLRPSGRGYLIVRASSGDAMRLAPDVRRAIQALDPTVPVPELQSIEDAMVQSIADRRMRALPAVGFGVLSLVVAFVGVLATLSTLVAERRRDLAIRSAVGASPARIVWTIMGHGLALTAAGMAVGLGLGSATARGLSSFVYGISPYDATTFAGTALAIGAGTVLMTYLAALRARGIDPIVVLKHE